MDNVPMNRQTNQTSRAEISLIYSNEKGTYLPKELFLKEDFKPE